MSHTFAGEHVHEAGSVWHTASIAVQNHPRLEALYQRVLQETGSTETAEGARAAAASAADAYYHEMVVKFGGDTARAQSYMGQAYNQIASIVELMPSAAQGNPGAIRSALSQMESMGMDPKVAYGWLNANIQNDSVLRSAGLDPKDVRKPADSLLAFMEPDEVLALAQSVLEKYRSPDGATLSPEEIEQWMQSARGFVEKYGVGAGIDWQQRYEPDTEVETVSVASLALPIRV